MLKDKLNEDLKAAMRAKDGVRLRAIRSIRAALLEKEINERQGGEATLNEEQEIAVLQKQAKQRRESIEQFRAAGRDDLAVKEQEELQVIEQYLPKQLGDEEIRKVVHQVIAGFGSPTPPQMGQVIGETMRLLRGRAEGRRVQGIVQEILTDLNRKASM
jgi:uncharacterized protein